MQNEQAFGLGVYLNEDYVFSCVCVWLLSSHPQVRNLIY